MSVHFVGMRGDEYFRAQRVFGVPDFIHNSWDKRAMAEIFDDDVVVFANREREDRVNEYTYDDSARF